MNTRYDTYDSKGRWMGGYDDRLTIFGHTAQSMAHDKARSMEGKVMKVTTDDNGLEFEEEEKDYSQ